MKKTKTSKGRVFILLVFVFFMFLFCVSCNVYASGAIVKIQQQQEKPTSPEPPPRQKPTPRQTVFPRENHLKVKTGPDEEHVIDFHMLWAELKITSEVWPLLIDTNIKEIIVSRYIALYERQGIELHKTSFFYVQAIDEMARKNPQLFLSPFKEVLKFVAIVEYDFDTGQNKDALARSLLGERLFQENRRRLGIQ